MHEYFFESALMLNDDGSIYHLHLLPEDIAHTIILVGDPDRVPMVSKNFDSIEVKKSNREFVTHTGYVNRKRLTVLSTGIGTDNIDIVLNELDALVNIDFKKRCIKPTLTQLNIVRIGTTGALQAEIVPGSTIVSSYAAGLDNAIDFYQHQQSAEEKQLQEVLTNFFDNKLKFYVIAGSKNLINLFKKDYLSGFTLTCPGFYGAQGRELRTKLTIPNLIEKMASFKFNDTVLTNIEMETAGIYGLCKAFNHHCCSLSIVVVNRITKKHDRHIEKNLEKAIKNTILRLTA